MLPIDQFDTCYSQAVKKRPLKLFYSYSSKDERLRMQLEEQLATLKADGLIQPWSSQTIVPGQEWDAAINEQLSAADLILLLVSAAFLSSDYIRTIELPRAMDRHNSGAAVVVPIIVRDVDWSNEPFAKLQMLPAHGRPVASFKNRDSGWAQVARGLRRTISDLIAPTVPIHETRILVAAVTKPMPPDGPPFQRAKHLAAALTTQGFTASAVGWNRRYYLRDLQSRFETDLTVILHRGNDTAAVALLEAIRAINDGPPPVTLDLLTADSAIRNEIDELAPDIDAVVAMLNIERD